MLDTLRELIAMIFLGLALWFMAFLMECLSSDLASTILGAIPFIVSFLLLVSLIDRLPPGFREIFMTILALLSIPNILIIVVNIIKSLIS